MGQPMLQAGWKLDNTYAHLPQIFFSLLSPTPVANPQLVVLNTALAASLGLDLEMLQSQPGVQVLSGNRIPQGAVTLAQAYAGHQFGHFTMLGDGRAVLLGEQLTPQGERFDIQLKGSGKTTYSRRGDGRAALGPMLREYIISEAMHGLGIPTTRSLAVVATGEPVFRETAQPGAILTRVAASHLRVGTFQFAARWGTVEDLRLIADYALQRHYPELSGKADSYLLFLQAVIKRQAALIAKWQLVGFVHGVMNTDNMTISGETIDYGPCAFMDIYDPATVFSSIDTHGRYAYGNQPPIGLWNLTRLAEALLPLLHHNQEQAVTIAQQALMEFDQVYYQAWLSGMRAKMGIANQEQQDESLVTSLLGMMKKVGADYTNTFRALTIGTLENNALFVTPEFAQWHEAWQARLNRQPQNNSHQLMQASNPAVIPRNFRVEAALDSAVNHGDYSVMDRLLTVLQNPYAYTAEQAEYSALPDNPTQPYRTFCGT